MTGLNTPVSASPDKPKVDLTEFERQARELIPVYFKRQGTPAYDQEQEIKGTRLIELCLRTINKIGPYDLMPYNEFKKRLWRAFLYANIGLGGLGGIGIESPAIRFFTRTLQPEIEAYLERNNWTMFLDVHSPGGINYPEYPELEEIQSDTIEQINSALDKQKAPRLPGKLKYDPRGDQKRYEELLRATKGDFYAAPFGEFNALHMLRNNKQPMNAVETLKVLKKHIGFDASTEEIEQRFTDLDRFEGEIYIHVAVRDHKTYVYISGIKDGEIKFELECLVPSDYSGVYPTKRNDVEINY